VGKREEFIGKKQWNGWRELEGLSFVVLAIAIFFVVFSASQIFQGTRCVILYPVS
jgi:hypothetical protein